MSVDRVDNIKDAPEKVLSRVIGHGSDGKGGAATLENLKEQLAITSADVAGAVPDTREVATEGGIQGGGHLDGDLTLSLTDTTVAAGTYGGASAVPVITVDAKGRVTAAEEVEVEVPASGVAADTYGSATEVPVLTISADGRVTDATTAPVEITDAVAKAQGGGGGKIFLEKSEGSALAGSLIVDTNGPYLRFYELGGDSRGFHVDLTQCGPGASSGALHTGNSSVAGRALLEAADVEAQRTALGVTMIKTGTVNAGASSGTVNFAAAFPTACLAVHLQVIGSSGSTTSYAAHLDGAPSAAAFSWYLRQTVAAGTTGASTAVGFRWTAFGN